jgi:ligand-binding SRPBCC domain-containing protein
LAYCIRTIQYSRKIPFLIDWRLDESEILIHITSNMRPCKSEIDKYPTNRVGYRIFVDFRERRILFVRMHAQFQAEQWLPYPVELVFAFFANPENLPRLMPKWQAARIEEASFRPPPPHPGAAPRHPGIVAGDGTRLTLSFRPFPYSPVRISWEAAIGHFIWNQQFCDTQLHGPFHFWHHCHKVTAAPHPETGAPGTLLRDEVEFELPLDPASRVALPIVRAQMAAMFRLRQKRTAELLALAHR